MIGPNPNKIYPTERRNENGTLLFYPSRTDGMEC